MAVLRVIIWSGCLFWINIESSLLNSSVCPACYLNKKTVYLFSPNIFIDCNLYSGKVQNIVTSFYAIVIF